MHFNQEEVYHIYNRSNNSQKIFFNERNYLFFLNKVREEWLKYGDILCFCLMPNHFHFIIAPNEEACKYITMEDKITPMQNLSKAIGKTLSSYTRAINNQNKTTGTLFQKKTKAKSLIEDSIHSTHEYLETCFHYIHQNPLAANLITNLKYWLYSSYPDYYGYRKGTLCNKEKLMSLLSYTEADFRNEEIKNLDDDIIQKLF